MKRGVIMGNFQSVLKSLRTERGLTQDGLSKALKVSRSTIGMYENGSREPDYETLELIADYFNVDIDYLLGRTDKTTKLINPHCISSDITAKDSRDIKKDLDNIMEKLTSKEAGPASYDGMDLSDESTELFRDELEIALKRLKLINKEKYNPNKNKK